LISRSFAAACRRDCRCHAAVLLRADLRMPPLPVFALLLCDAAAADASSLAALDIKRASGYTRYAQA